MLTPAPKPSTLAPEIPPFGTAAMAQTIPPTWRTYERIIAAIEVDAADVDVTITPNARLTGEKSGKKRQIDVLIDARWGDDFSRRVIVDAKLKSRPIDIKDVEGLMGMMADCRADRGVIVCPHGWTKGALRRAQDSVIIKLLPPDDIDEFSWISSELCLGSCVTSSRRRPGFIFWDSHSGLDVDGAMTVFSTGKCDECHDFHVRCQGCGEKFALAVEDNHACNCGLLWASVIEEEIEEPNKGALNAVHLLLAPVTETPRLFALDRRALR